MTIRRLLQYSSVPPEEMVRLRIAYQKTLKALDLVDRNDPISEIVAKQVIQIASMGVRDPRGNSLDLGRFARWYRPLKRKGATARKPARQG